MRQPGVEDSVPTPNQEFLHARLPHSRMDLLPAGHFAWEEVPDLWRRRYQGMACGTSRRMRRRASITECLTGRGSIITLATKKQATCLIVELKDLDGKLIIEKRQTSPSVLRAGSTDAYETSGMEAFPSFSVQHFRGNLDNWDPALIEMLASSPAVSSPSTMWGGG